MTKQIKKPDLLDTITRRRRTVKTFLREKQVTKLGQLTPLIVELKPEYEISEKFLDQALAILSPEIFKNNNSTSTTEEKEAEVVEFEEKSVEEVKDAEGKDEIVNQRRKSKNSLKGSKNN